MPPACRVADYTGFREGAPDPSVFHTPQLCEGQQAAQAAAQGRRAASQLRWSRMVPAVLYQGDAEVGGGRGGTSHPACTVYLIHCSY